VNLTDLIGSAAACLTTASFLPQAWLSFRTRDVSGVSLGMYSVFTAGVALWLAYGLLLGSWPMVIANTITLALALMILGMKLVYGRPSPSLPAAAKPGADAP
jgi:MtN3 and saliva related transmembrane protein